jgi:3-phenylpropionate/trans-cinnamate dioxygenase ferredoxin reductase component
VRGDVEAREFIAFWLSGGRVLAGMNVNTWDVAEDIERLIRSQDGVGPGHLADPTVALSEI